ncbi:uncharacterized protein LOC107884213 [Acyrthosiphon pisum]|uniref:Uncharacterized protein n=1 Tax=Acyrthosiphon pisum TaxID=7029 RepID=A0A8R2H5M1_ACYPI|nr:uncharacterized protein LOC107884213 [Acyrthosiphon pisum]|eukprot:XP_016661351.1 PREDICTED: uncharacterized protein LOC107884213 [Acyrthosiphon pisum]
MAIKEFVAKQNGLPVTDVTWRHIAIYLDALDGFSEFVKCIYFALCGATTPSHKAQLTVVDWLRRPVTIERILFSPEAANNKNLGGELGVYPMYDVQKSVWVTPNDRLQFAPSLTTKRGIEDVLEQYHNPRYPNFNFPKPQKSRKQRRPPINIELLNQQDNQLAIAPPPPLFLPLPPPSLLNPLLPPFLFLQCPIPILPLLLAIPLFLLLL